MKTFLTLTLNLAKTIENKHKSFKSDWPCLINKPLKKIFNIYLFIINQYILKQYIYIYITKWLTDIAQPKLEGAGNWNLACNTLEECYRAQRENLKK